MFNFPLHWKSFSSVLASYNTANVYGMTVLQFSPPSRIHTHTRFKKELRLHILNTKRTFKKCFAVNQIEKTPLAWLNSSGLTLRYNGSRSICGRCGCWVEIEASPKTITVAFSAQSWLFHRVTFFIKRFYHVTRVFWRLKVWPWTLCDCIIQSALHKLCTFQTPSDKTRPSNKQPTIRWKCDL